MSLCYYCSAGMAPNSRAMFIESGVETENLERAEEAIYSQLHALQRGDLTEEELLSAQLALQNSLRSATDSLPAIEGLSLGQLFGGHVLSPEEVHPAAHVLHERTGGGGRPQAPSSGGVHLERRRRP